MARSASSFIRAVCLGAILWVGGVTTSQAGTPDFLVDAAWLEDRIADPDLVILETRYYPHRYHTVGHIQGAVQVKRLLDLGDNSSPVIMRAPSTEAFQATLRQWGVKDDSLIVIYDDSRTVLASRLYYLLDLYGFDMGRVKVLDGGTVEWTAFNDLVTAAPAPVAGSVTLKAPAERLVAEWIEVYDAVVAQRDPGVVLIDARPAPMYSGDATAHSVQAGHIPGAINIVSLDGTDAQSQKWLPMEALAAKYAGVPKDATVITYCHDGFRSTLAWLQLKALGYTDVRVFNGGWGQWDRTLTLPVVEGNHPFDADFSL